MTTAVQIKCPQRHVVAELNPLVGATGVVDRMDIVRKAARYSPAMAGHITGDTTLPIAGWVILPDMVVRMSLAEFDDPSSWPRELINGTWACRCGRWRLPYRDIIDAAWAWSTQRKTTGNTAPRVLLLEEPYGRA